MNQLNNKVQLSSEEILKRYFYAYQPRWDVLEVKYDQMSVDKSLMEIDATEIVNRKCYYINMFLGANCSNSNNLDFDHVKSLFLSGKRYTQENFGKLGIGFNFEDTPSVNLSNNDFGKYNFVWDFEKFFAQIYQGVYGYVYPSFSRDFDEAREEDEEEFYTYGSFYGDASAYVTREFEKVIKLILKKLIPVVQNTGIRILINPSSISLNGRYEFLEEILKSHSFDGCYIKVVDCYPEFAEKFGLSEKDFELFQYDPNISRERKK